MNRRDNPNSSVKSKEKVMCIKNEYDHILNYLNQYPDDKKRLIGMYHYKKFHNYMFNFDRIDIKFKWEWLQIFSKEYKEAYALNEIDENLFSSKELNWLRLVISNPNKFYKQRLIIMGQTLEHKNFTHLYIKPYLLFPFYLIKTARMKKKIHKKICRIIRGQLSRQFENTLLLTKPQIRDFALKNSSAPDYVKKNIKKITNDIYDKFHFRKKHRILGIKFYTKNKHKELSSLLTYSIKQNDLLKQNQIYLQKENDILKTKIEETKKELQKTIQSNKNDIVNLRNYLNQQTNIIQERLLSVTDYKKALEIWYRSKKGKVLNLDNPQTFNEKIQWLKLYDSTPLKTQLADKYRVREWIKEKIGEEYLIPLLGVYDSFDEIDFDKLPNQFVIKCNHGSGYNIIVKDKSTLNIQDAKNKINSWMKEDFAFKNGYELHYHGIQPKIIIEEFIDPYISNHEIQAWIFNNEIKFISVETIKDATNLERSTFYLDGKETEFQVSPIYYKKLKSNISPHIFNKAIDIAKKLKLSIPYVRIDLIEYNGDIKFREFTFTPGSGLSQIYPSNYSKTLGDWLILPSKIYNISTKEYSKV